MHGVPGMLGPRLDVHVPVADEVPDRLGVVGQERRRGAEEPLPPGRCRGVVAGGGCPEPIHGHDLMLGVTVLRAWSSSPLLS